VSATVTLEPWGSGDLPLLERLMGDPRMTEHLGGPESPDKLRERQGRYERLESGDRMFKIVDAASGAGVGSVGFWTKEWRDEQVYEIGWMVVPEFQGRGIAVAATAQAIELAKRDDKHRFMHAFPNIDNAPSNSICRKLGFELLEACEFEFPKGHFMTCNDWRLDLRAITPLWTQPPSSSTTIAPKPSVDVFGTANISWSSCGAERSQPSATHGKSA
jgi:RimJ/RimL family protein N-acetyltransferase